MRNTGSSPAGSSGGAALASDFNLLPQLPEIEGEDVVRAVAGARAAIEAEERPAGLTRETDGGAEAGDTKLPAFTSHLCSVAYDLAARKALGLFGPRLFGREVMAQLNLLGERTAVARQATRPVLGQMLDTTDPLCVRAVVRQQDPVHFAAFFFLSSFQ